MANVYKHTRTDKNEIFYIGISNNSIRPYSRFKRSKYWKSIANKGYEVEILYTGLTWLEACNKEIELIKFYGRKDLGLGTLCNLTDGGEGTVGYKLKYKRIVSDETKLKISIANTGKIRTDETKLKLKEYNTGLKKSKEICNKISIGNIGKQKNRNYKMSDEQKLKISIANTGKIFSEERKNNISKSQKGKIKSEETKLKISNSLIGKIGRNTGNTHSEETKLKISNSKKGISISEETKLKISNSKKGKLKSEETKINMKIAQQLRRNNLKQVS